MGVEIICHGNDCKVTGKSKVLHQIDVLSKHSDGLHVYKTAIECKYWDKTINKDIIMKVAAIIEDAGINKGVIVSKNGYTSDAISFAEYKNIGLVELREMTEKDWEGRLQNLNIEVNLGAPKITAVDFLQPHLISSGAGKTAVNLELLQIKKVTGEKKTFDFFIKDFFKELSNQTADVQFEKTYFFESGTLIINKLTQQEAQATGIKITGILKVQKVTIDIRGEDHVWLIMKSIFENKTYTISKDGMINERED